MFFHDPHPGAASLPPFLNDDTPLSVNLLIFKFYKIGPFGEYLQSLYHCLFVIRRNLQLVNGFVEAGRGVDIRAESRADGFKVIDDVCLLKMNRSVESHVLDKMGKAKLAVLFKNRAGINNKP